MHQDERGARHRPAGLAGLVRQHDAHAWRFGPVGAGGCCFEGFVIRAHKLTIAIAHLRVVELVALGVGKFNIADRTDQFLYIRRHPFIALAADTGDPFNRSAFADLGFPIGTDLGKVVGEQKGGARAVRAVHHRDVGVGHFDAAIEGDDGRIIPLLDLAQVNIGQHFTGQLEIALTDFFQIHYRHDAAHDGRKLHQPLLFEFLGFERHVGCAKVNRLGGNLLDAATRTNRLVVHAGAGRLFISVSPFGVNRVGEGGARTGNVDCVGGNAGQADAHRGNDGSCKSE